MTTHTIHALPHVLPAAQRVVALGRFDGVHLGHRAVITAASRLLRYAPHADTLSVFTLTGLSKGGDLCDNDGLMRALQNAGADELIELDFSCARTLSPQAFVTAFLRDTLHATAVVCGFNFRFGTDRAGDAETLRTLCEAEGIVVTVVDAVCDDEGVISSSRIRHCLQQGDVRQVHLLLGYPFTLRFPVVNGQHLGRKLGFPTINQVLPETFVRPRFGVYASAVVVDGTVTYGVTNIGTHPTVGETVPVAETWIPDFSGDLYGQHVPVTPVCFLREEQKFPSLEALTAQVKADAVAAKHAVLGDGTERDIRAVLLDFDDTLQNRRVAFTAYARGMLKHYFPEQPEAWREQAAQYMMRCNNGGYKPDGTPLNYPAYFAEMANYLGADRLPPSDHLYRDYARLFPPCSHPFEDAIQTLRLLKEQGYRVGVITNGTAVIQSRKLDHSGLRPLLDITVISGDEGVRKPDAEIFRRAAAYLGVAPEACVYVGDHIVNDIEGANAAGMRAVYIDAFSVNAPCHAPRIEQLSELPSLLSTI